MYGKTVDKYDTVFDVLIDYDITNVRWFTSYDFQKIRTQLTSTNQARDTRQTPIWSRSIKILFSIRRSSSFNFFPLTEFLIPLQYLSALSHTNLCAEIFHEVITQSFHFHTRSACHSILHVGIIGLESFCNNFEFYTWRVCKNYDSCNYSRWSQFHWHFTDV